MKFLGKVLATEDYCRWIALTTGASQDNESCSLSIPVSLLALLALPWSPDDLDFGSATEQKIGLVKGELEMVGNIELIDGVLKESEPVSDGFWVQRVRPDCFQRR